MKYNPPTTLDLLRHGECQGDDIYRGHTDVELTDAGWQQMRNALECYSKNPPWKRIISSPLKRCECFSTWLEESTRIKATTMTELKEMSFGDWEGLLRRDIWHSQRDRVKNFMDDPVKYPPPRGEDLVTFQQRVLSGLSKLLNQYRGQHLLLVQHGGTMRIILAHLLNMPLDKIHRIDVPFASLSRIKIFHENEKIYPLLIFHNRLHEQSAKANSE